MCVGGHKQRIITILKVGGGGGGGGGGGRGGEGGLPAIRKRILSISPGSR